MQLKNLNLNLKQKIQQNSVDTLMLSPDEIAGFLAICNEALISYVLNANAQLGGHSEAFITTVEVEKIDSVFRELSNNFFPMAHSNEPLGHLQIVNKDEHRRVIHGLLTLTRLGHDAHELSKYLSESIERLINP